MRRFSSARRGPLVRMTVLAVGLGLSVAGCSGAGSGPGTAPTSGHVGTPDASTTATPTSNPTDVAAAAAIAAVKRLYAELNSAIHSGSTAIYRRQFTKQCQICVHDANTTDAIYKRGEHVEGGTYQVTNLAVVWDKPDRVIVQGVLSATSLTVRRRSQIITQNRALRPSDFTWDVVPYAGTWLVSRVEALR